MHFLESQLEKSHTPFELYFEKKKKPQPKTSTTIAVGFHAFRLMLEASTAKLGASRSVILYSLKCIIPTIFKNPFKKNNASDRRESEWCVWERGGGRKKREGDKGT